ncbi:ATP-binding protein [bacterium]|nr:ATP-binding protein [bacterium]
MFKDYQKTIFILIGLQASGKTTFSREYFAGFDIVSLDILKTRKKEDKMISDLIRTGKNFVIDNTNLTIEERKKYIDIADGYKKVGIYFRSTVDECSKRNLARGNKVPLKAILSSAKKLKQPSYGENFDELYYVKIENNKFHLSKWDETL